MDTAAKTSRRTPVAKVVLQLAGGMAVGAVVGAAIAHFAMNSLPKLELGILGKIGLAVAVVLAFPLLVGVHELGHVLGGVAAGFRVLLFMVGPLRVEREGERFQVRFAFKGALFGGLAACAPMDTRDLRRRTLWLIAGGPLASFVAGVLLLVMRSVLDAPPVADTLLLVTGGISLLIWLAAAIPSTAGGFYSDGARIIRLVRGGADVEREVACLAIIGLSMGGARPRDWSPELVARAAAGEPDTLFGVAGRMYAHAHEMDAGRVDAARAHMQAAVEAAEILPKQARPGLMLQAAFFAARVDRDPARAREHLERAAGGVMLQPHSRPLVEAAVAWAEGDRALAAERLDAAEAARGDATDPGMALMAADQIAALRRELAA
jgi:hypothetical protein